MLHKELFGPAEQGAPEDGAGRSFGSSLRDVKDAVKDVKEHLTLRVSAGTGISCDFMIRLTLRAPDKGAVNHIGSRLVPQGES